jgi:hypothetical protein
VAAASESRPGRARGVLGAKLVLLGMVHGIAGCVHVPRESQERPMCRVRLLGEWAALDEDVREQLHAAMQAPTPCDDRQLAELRAQLDHSKLAVGSFWSEATAFLAAGFGCCVFSFCQMGRCQVSRVRFQNVGRWTNRDPSSSRKTLLAVCPHDLSSSASSSRRPNRQNSIEFAMSCSARAVSPVSACSWALGPPYLTNLAFASRRTRFPSSSTSVAQRARADLSHRDRERPVSSRFAAPVASVTRTFEGVTPAPVLRQVQRRSARCSRFFSGLASVGDALPVDAEPRPRRRRLHLVVHHPGHHERLHRSA